jgi:tripartite-type tricarboxylate transporter receptor subunit TctC
MKKISVRSSATLWLCLWLLTIVAWLPTLAQASDWPSKPIKLVVGFGAGGPTDVVARAFADQAGKGLAQPAVVDNKPGANSIIAAESVALSSDGHTFLIAATNHTMIPAFYAGRVKFDAIKSFKPICMLAVAPTVLVVNASLPVKSLADFVQRAKANPSAITYGTPGIGSSVHFASELLSQQAGVRMTHVPYKGAANVVTDLIAAQLDASFATLGSVLPHIKSGKLVALAIANAQRSQLLPDVPTFAQAGYSQNSADAWYGLLAPSSTNDAQVAALQREARAFAASSAGSERLRGLGMEPRLLCGEAFAKQISQEVDTYSHVARELNLKLE